jgi:hypothetical protein
MIRSDDLLDLSAAARRLHVPRSWLRREAHEGRVPCLRAGSRYLFSWCALSGALASRAGNPEAASHPIVLQDASTFGVEVRPSRGPEPREIR